MSSERWASLAAARVCWWVSWNARTMHRYKPWRCLPTFTCGKNSRRDPHQPGAGSAGHRHAAL